MVLLFLMVLNSHSLEIEKSLTTNDPALKTYTVLLKISCEDFVYLEETKIFGMTFSYSFSLSSEPKNPSTKEIAIQNEARTVRTNELCVK